MKKIIEVKNLTKRFDGLVAVNDVSFSIDKGEIFGFLGPNGAGKTTTIRMLTGLLIPDSGEMFIDGIDVETNPVEAKMKTGVIPEMGNIYMDLTAEQNIVLAGRFYGFSVRELGSKAHNLINKFGLSAQKDKPVRTLSKGMKQRVNIASAIVHNPDILFLDEPTSGLDVQSQRMIRDIIKERNKKGTTVFLTTHNIEEANQLCERVGIINKGRMVVVARPEVLRRTFEKTKSVEVSFDRRIQKETVEKSLQINRVEQKGDKWKLFTDNPDKLVKQISKFSEDKGLSIVALEICRESLEDAFVKFTKDDYATT
jgi:ABC-2 type transport system ATP-binding protein